ncbi:MAG: multidrug resistance efflux pump [Planctomycetaceae bacterium]
MGSHHPLIATSESVNPDQRSSQPTIDDALSDVESVIEDLTQSESVEPVFAGFQTELPQDAAQIDNASGAAQLASPTPTPPPKRPKGRLLIGSLLMILFAAAFFIVWDGVFRYQAYGLVEGNRVAVRTSSAGFVQKVFVAEGDLVRTGDLLLTIENVELEHRLERTRDSIRLAEAQLDAHIAKLRRIARQREWDVLDNAAEFFELASELPKRRSEVERLERGLARTQKAQEFDGVSVSDLDDIQFALNGEQGLLKELVEAVAALQTRNDLTSDEAELDLAELKPTMVHIENLQNETHRLYEQFKASNIVAPMTGIVVKHRCVAGKWVETSEELLEIVEEGTVEPVLYLSQGDTRNVEPGTEIVVHIAPLGEPVNCLVRRIANEFRVPPEQLVRYYDSGEPLLPVILEPADGIPLRLGAMVKVPHDFARVLDSFQ